MTRTIDADELRNQIKHMPRTANPDLVQYSLVQAIIANAPTLTPPNEPLSIEQAEEGITPQKVYVVCSGFFSDRCIEGFCLTEEEARQVCATKNSERRSSFTPWWYCDADVYQVCKEGMSAVKPLWVAECELSAIGEWAIEVREEENATVAEGKGWVEIHDIAKRDKAYGHIDADSEEEAVAKARQLLKRECEKLGPKGG